MNEKNQEDLIKILTNFQDRIEKLEIVNVKPCVDGYHNYVQYVLPSPAILFYCTKCCDLI